MVDKINEGKSPSADPPTTESYEEAAIVALIKDYVEAFNPFRESRITEWNNNIAYLMGHQYIGLDGGHLVEMDNKNPFAVTANKIQPAVMNDIAIGTKASPKFDVVPDNTDEDDRATAVVGEKVSEHLAYVNNLRSLRAATILWYDIANIAWAKTTWNAKAKMIGKNPEPEEWGQTNAPYDENVEPGQPLFEGEVEIEPVAPNEIIHDWRCNVNKLQWIIHTRSMTLGDVEARYGFERAAAIQSSQYLNTASEEERFEVKLYGEFSDLYGRKTTKPREQGLHDRSRQVQVFEFWHICTEGMPEGLYTVLAGDQLMIAQPYPIETYKHNEIPFTAYQPLAAHPSLSGTASRISQARPLQRELNDVRTLINENIATLGGGLWMASERANLQINTLENGVGLVVSYSGTYKPSREAGVPVPNSLFNHVEKIERDIDGIFSFHAASKGIMPKGGPKSAVGLQVLQEADVTQVSPIIKDIELQDQRVMRQALDLAMTNYTKRTLKLVGDDNEWVLYEFDPESVRGNYNVKVRAGSSLPINKAYERDMALTMLQAGLLGDPNDPVVKQKVLETIDLGGLDKVLKSENKDVGFAKKEFLVPIHMYTQNPIDWENATEEQIEQALFLPQVNNFDDHQTHILVHRTDLVDKYWKLLQSGDPGLAILAKGMVDHLTQHYEIYNEMQMRAAIMSGQIKPRDLEAAEQGATAA